ncbi:MAG TPA: hypothetical protein VFW40_10780, partial [Capsulimonadaceae bacterium]|nr:hypothetical protein [Capsulimonadaceae bacterium]
KALERAPATSESAASVSVPPITETQKEAPSPVGSSPAYVEPALSNGTHAEAPPEKKLPVEDSLLAPLEAEPPLPEPVEIKAPAPVEAQAEIEPPQPAPVKIEPPAAPMQAQAEIEPSTPALAPIVEPVELEALAQAPIVEPAEVETPVPAIIDRVEIDRGGTADPLSAWAPYRPPGRAKSAPPVEQPAVEESAEPAPVQAAEEAQFQPFAIKPVAELRMEEAETVAEEAAPELEPMPSPASREAPPSVNGPKSENSNGLANGSTFAEPPGSAPEPRGNAEASGKPADPYSAVYTLTELGVTDVAEIARRTGLGQTEVEMVLNLWRRQ